MMDMGINGGERTRYIENGILDPTSGAYQNFTISFSFHYLSLQQPKDLVLGMSC